VVLFILVIFYYGDICLWSLIYLEFIVGGDCCAWRLLSVGLLYAVELVVCGAYALKAGFSIQSLPPLGTPSEKILGP
jgi:hypothetical protein